MFIGIVLKFLEIEDLVSCFGLNEFCYLVRFFIQFFVVFLFFKDVEIKNFEGNDFFFSEGEEKFYEVLEILVDFVDYIFFRIFSFS